MKLVHKSQIKGEFYGWENNRIYELIDGHIWKQNDYEYDPFSYAHQPNAKIWKDGSTYYLEVEVEGKSTKVKVKLATPQDVEEAKEKAKENEKYNKYYELAFMRLEDFGNLNHVLRKESKKIQKIAKTFRICTIVLGAFVAIKGIIDQLMINYQPTSNMSTYVDIIFTLVGVIIATLGTLQEAFKFEQRASAVMELSSRANTHSREFMSKIETGETPEKLLKVIDEENYALKELYSDAAKQDINLVYESNIEYSQLLTKK